jgi:N-acetylmuramoyl-L-alanine amidase
MDVKKNQPNRKVLVFVSLIGTLTLTSALLLSLAPAPLTADTATSLFAVDTPTSLDPVFDTQTPTTAGRWRYIYIHQSRTVSGSAASLAQANALSDHFVIGNGDGCVDGEIQITQRWNLQSSILNPPVGVSKIDPACISICLIGDFDQGRPTPTQERRLAQLVDALQSRLQIPAKHVLTMDEPGSPAGVGRQFPVTAFRNQILP